MHSGANPGTSETVKFVLINVVSAFYEFRLVSSTVVTLLS